MLRIIGVIGVSCLSLAAAPADFDETLLRRTFEGKTVAVKVDMPGDDNGIGLYPEREDPADWRKISESIKRYGVALRKGDEVMVTKVHVKPKVIEFQLGGGGYGSFADMMAKPSVPSTSTGKSSRERDLERRRNGASGEDRRRIDRELDRLEHDRRRDESRARSGEVQAKADQRAWEEDRRLRSGSRFNLHYPNGVPDSATTPEAIMAMLAEYVDFSMIAPRKQVRAATSAAALKARPSADASALKKGMTEITVQKLLGEPVTRKRYYPANGDAGIDATYNLPNSTVKARYAYGELSEFTVTPK